MEVGSAAVILCDRANVEYAREKRETKGVSCCATGQRSRPALEVIQALKHRSQPAPTPANWQQTSTKPLVPS